MLIKIYGTNNELPPVVFKSVVLTVAGRDVVDTVILPPINAPGKAFVAFPVNAPKTLADPDASNPNHSVPGTKTDETEWDDNETN